MPTTLLSALATSSGEEAHRFFAETSAEELVAAVRATGNDDLQRLLARDEVRLAAVPGILARLDEYAVAERLREIEGLARFDLVRGPARSRATASHGVRFGGGTLEVLAPGADLAGADVVLSVDVLGFVRLVSGERNAGLEFLAGDLDIDGDAALALAIGGVFRIPGQEGVALDPSALDPVDVATALARTTPEHLRKVMAGGFRAVVLEEIFRRLPDFVNARRARDVRLVVGFRLTGSADGEVERYVVRLAGGAATVTGADADDGGAGERDATITCEGHDFLRLATGHLGAISGVLRGQLKVRGDRSAALQFASVMEFPRARTKAPADPR